MPTRRKLIKTVGLAAAVLPLSSYLTAAEKKLNILFLGGTGLIGPHAVATALARGHSVTLFNRGRTNPGLFAGLETIIGDRNTDDIDQLRGRKWDVVIDTSAYYPRSVNMAMEALEHGIDQYVLISTTSVYTSWANNTDESGALRTIADPTIEEIRQPATYGALKALCEQAAEAHLPGKVTVIRPGFIAGPGDETDRFTYWPVRIKRGGTVLAPGTGNDYVQFIDVRDLGDWIIHCLEQSIVGTFNAHNQYQGLTMAQLLDACKKALNPAAELIWVDADFLESHRVIAGVDMPLWQNGGLALNSNLAIANGLQQRPLQETVVDTHEWFLTLPAERQNELRAGLSAEPEAMLLAEWAKSNR